MLTLSSIRRCTSANDGSLGVLLGAHCRHKTSQISHRASPVQAALVADLEIVVACQNLLLGHTAVTDVRCVTNKLSSTCLKLEECAFSRTGRDETGASSTQQSRV